MANNHLLLKPPILNLNQEHNYYMQKDEHVNNGKHTLDVNDSDLPQNKKSLIEPSLSQIEVMTTETITNTESGFTLVKNRKSKSSSSMPLSHERYKTTINNRFDALSDDGEMDSESQNQDNLTKRIPPIFLHDANNHQALINDLDSLLKDEYFTEVKGKSVKVSTSSSDDFRTLTAHLDKSKIEYHSFCPPENKHLSVIMRNVPLSLSDDEIFSELKSQNYPVLKVARLYGKNKYPMPLCAIHLEDTDMGAEIFGLEFICHSKIKIEHKRQPKSIPQCTRCQRFGHTKNYCRLEPRCVKCSGNHLYTQCPKKKDDPVECVNCGEEHSANYRGCSYYINLKSKIDKKSNTTRNVKTNASNSTYIDNGEFPTLQKNNENLPENNSKQTQHPKSYSKAVTENKARSSPSKSTGRSTEPKEESSLENDDIHPILSSIFSWLKQFIPQIKTFISELLTNLLTNGN